MRPSRLYRRLDLTGPTDRLVNVQAGDASLDDRAASIRISRGGSDLSSYSASTVTVETPQNVPLGSAGKDLSITLAPEAADLISAATGETVEDVRWRYRGRVATQTAHDRQNRRHAPAAWRGTTLVGAAWASLYQNAPDLYVPNTNLNADPDSLDAAMWRATGDHTSQALDGMWAIRVLENASGGALYVDPVTNFPVAPGETVHVEVEVKVTTTMPMRLRIAPYDGATGNVLTPAVTQTPADGWVNHTASTTIGGSPGGYVRTLVWPDVADLPAGEGFYIRKMRVTKSAPYSDGRTLHRAAQDLLLPSWAPFATLEWKGDSDSWPNLPEGQAHPAITASDLLGILSDRLYMLGDTRQGHFRVASLTAMEANAAAAAVNTWPLARAHVLAPTTWDQPSTYPTEYRVLLRPPSGGTYEIITAPGGVPTGETRLEDLDWSELVRDTEQWRRVYGRRWQTFQGYWRIPSVTVRLDHLLASRYASHRRAAGMLLRLNVGDPVPLAGDWPGPIDGVHFATSMEEQITPDAWSLTIGLTPYNALAGEDQLPVLPRTWDQAGTRTWDDAGTDTWNEGITA